MSEQVPAVQNDQTFKQGSPGLDWIGGASLGALLAMLVGMTITPVVSIVVTALVALLGGLFSLSGTISTALPPHAMRRLAAFSVAAAAVLPVALLMRSHDLLGRSVESHVRELEAMKITSAAEQRELLKFLRFGLKPSGYTIVEGAGERLGGGTLLYTFAHSLCDELKGLGREAALEERLKVLQTGGNKGIHAARIVRARPEEEQLAAADVIQDYECNVEEAK